MLRVVDTVRRHGAMWDRCVFRAGRHIGFGLCGGSGKDSDGKWLQWGRRAIEFCRRPNWGSWKAWLSIFCRCPSQLWEKLGQRAGIPGTCLFVFLHEKGGHDSSNLTSSVRRRGQERTVRLDIVAGTVGIITIPQRPRTMRWRTEKTDIALLAREILYNPYFAHRANSALL